MSSSSSAPTLDWNAANYLRFADERTRPARDLLAAIPPLPSSSSPRIIDLGCGPANSTALLAERYGEAAARLTGVDSSPNMLDKARKVLPSAAFVEGDLRTYEPSGSDADPVDLFFTNAALHWLPDAELLPAIKRWVGHLKGSGGVFAMQVPDNVREPSHMLMAEVAKELGVEEVGRSPFLEPRVLVEELLPLCERVEVWHTVYNHRLEKGAEGVLDWFRESGLRPYLERLESEEEKRRFEGVYLEKAREAYPPLRDGSVLLRFPRLFLVCVKK
ncbi:Trans-aconitate 2-methyltransferase [Lasiodiplodia hormozganensis]|uniref:Trans-aconitate 2-methyltransferase n=1 Tax=Lasiodiplodia hormozganensis TaxID=869390 RepID=A0AA39Y753_9PEZI|nr:Trans-aconitate 2-methyltransferase [Lasiodiplodia hormozganensis]